MLEQRFGIGVFGIDLDSLEHELAGFVVLFILHLPLGFREETSDFAIGGSLGFGLIEKGGETRIAGF